MTISKSDEVYNYIKANIINRRLKPGIQLKENDISSILDISRTPIRKAFRKLELEGLVETKLHKGTFVVDPSVEEMVAANELRIHLEKLLIEQIIENVTAEDIDVLEELVDEELNYYKLKYVYKYLDVNKKFHMRIAHLSANKYLVEAFERILNVIHVHLIFYDRYNQMDIDNLRGLNQHRLIVKHLKEGNQKQLTKVMLEHSNSTLSEVKSNKINI